MESNEEAMQPLLTSDRYGTLRENSPPSDDSRSEEVASLARKKGLDLRFRFMARLNQHSVNSGGRTFSFVSDPPLHVLSELFVSQPDRAPKSSAHATFSLVNTMLGSSLLTLPWAFGQSGLIGVAVVFAVGAFSYFTSRLIVRHADEAGVEDFADLCRALLGDWSWYLALTGSTVVLLGGCLTYNVLLTDSIYDLVRAAPGTSHWSHFEAAICVWVGAFALSSIRDFKIVVKITSIGFLFVVFNIVFLLVRSAPGLARLSLGNVPVVGENWGRLAGLSTATYFCHNIIISVFRANRGRADAAQVQKQESLAHGLAFLLVFAVIVLVGLAPMLACADGAGGKFGAMCPPPQGKAPLSNEQNILNVFSITEGYAISARVALCIQILSLYPLLLSILRTQFLGMLHIDGNSSWLRMLGFNLVVTGLSFFVTVVYPHPGLLMDYAGALAGIIYVCTLPILVHVKLMRGLGTSSWASEVFYLIAWLFGVALVLLQFLL